MSYGGGLEEQDVFGSDFESTDEEAEQQGVDAGETMIREEEQRARRVRTFVLPLSLNKPLTCYLDRTFQGGEGNCYCS